MAWKEEIIGKTIKIIKIDDHQTTVK